MIEATVAGTGFSCELATGFPCLNVTAVWGLGEGLVSGDVTADGLERKGKRFPPPLFFCLKFVCCSDWIFSSDGAFRLIRRVKGSKTGRFQFKSGMSGIEFVENSTEMRDSFCLPNDVARDVAQKLSKVHSFYREKFHYEHVDTELAVAMVNGAPKVFFLQCRAVVPVAQKAVLTVDDGHIEDVIVTGRYSLPGAVVGRICVVTFESLADGSAVIDKDDIVVAVKTGNAWTPFLKTLAALVTEEGSPTSHPMLIGRERGIAVLVGVTGAVETLSRFQGQIVTLDGLQKRVYIGQQKLKSASAAELQKRFSPPPPPVLQSDDESRAFLKNFSRGFLDAMEGGLFWSAMAEHPVSPFWADLLAASLQERLAILNRCTKRGKVVDGSLLCNEVRREVARNGRISVFDRLMPIQKTMQLVEDLDASEMVRDRDAVVAEYLAACSDFAAVGTKTAFERYTRAWTVFFAHKWLSWFFRTHLEHAMVREAIRLNVAEMHLDHLIETELSKLSSSDLDLDLYREIKRLATLDQVSPSELLKLAREFKVGKCTDIAEEPGVEIVKLKVALFCYFNFCLFESVLQVSQRREQRGMATSQAQLLVSGEYVNVEPLDTTEQFPEEECAPLRAAVAVCVLARRQHR
jgi:phosphohistidine swiveling domain-containing protein